MEKQGNQQGDVLDMGMRSNKKENRYLVWEDVSVTLMEKQYCSYIHNKMMKMKKNKESKTLASKKKKLVHGVSGYALGGRIMAIMGPSGSGKSTLLDALSGRLSPDAIMTGHVSLNGKKSGVGCRSISYVTQENFLLASLTVKETLTYSAHLRLPSSMAHEEINAVVEKTIKEMGLQDCAHTNIGNWHLRGISGGEKTRVSIGLEMLTQPLVMFLDEPTSGLDSASAFFVIQALKNVALDDRVVVCSVHQPNSFIFDLFDDLCLLSAGETIYFGDAKTASEFFAEAGFPCPTRTNPADHFLRCINSDFDNIFQIRFQSPGDNSGLPESSNSKTTMSTQDIKTVLIEKYQNSTYLVNTRKRIRETKLTAHDELESESKMKVCSWWKQLSVLTRRSFVNITRDAGYYWIRILFCILVAMGAGIMFFDIGLSFSSILARSKCYTFFYDFMLCLSVGGLPSISEEWKVLYYERLNGHYGEGVFVVSNFLSSVPFLAIIALSSGSIIYYMVKFHMGFDIFSYFCINLFCCVSIMESVSMIVALLVPNFLMGVGVSAAVIMFLTISSGLYRQVHYLPKFFWRYPMSYISFTTWSIQGQYKNDMMGLEFEAMVPGGSEVKGEKILEMYYGLDPRWSKWWDMGAVILLLLWHRVLFFIILKYKDRVQSLVRRVYAKETVGENRRNGEHPGHPLSCLE